MKKILALLFVPIVCQAQLIAEKYLTLGVGFSSAIYESKDLDRFTETYNSVYRADLLARFKGLGSGEGLRWEAGYRRLGRWSMAVLAGWQNYLTKDAARFANGEARNLELKMSSLYVEYELGRAWNNFFVNGALTVFFNRKFTLESKYSGPASEAANKTLNGTYKTDKAISVDAGIALGIFREPIFIVGKITYPLFTGGSSVFEDKAATRTPPGFDVFPSDYESYLQGQDYPGVSGDVDGLKILVTAAFAIRLK